MCAIFLNDFLNSFYNWQWYNKSVSLNEMKASNYIHCLFDWLIDYWTICISPPFWIMVVWPRPTKRRGLKNRNPSTYTWDHDSHAVVRKFSFVCKKGLHGLNTLSTLKRLYMNKWSNEWVLMTHWRYHILVTP